MGKYEEAEPLYRRALAGREAALGAEHPDTLMSVNNLAVLLKDMGKYEEAEPLYRRALAGQEAALGAEHPDTLSSVNNLAILLRTWASMRRRAAVPASAGGEEAALGAEHPHTGQRQ